MWRSPNGTIRNILGGVIFREPIVISQHPAAGARLDQADHHRPSRARRPVQGHRLQGARPRHGDHHLHARGRWPSRWSIEVADFPRAAGSRWACTTTDKSIEDFARASFRYGLEREYPVYLSTKNTILKAYDGVFKDMFAEVFEREFKADFEARPGSPTSTG